MRVTRQRWVKWISAITLSLGTLISHSALPETSDKIPGGPEKGESFQKPQESFHIYGNPNADYSIVSYMDFTCQYCRRIRPSLKRMVNQSNGNTNWIFRHYPLTEAPDKNLLESVAAECSAIIGGNSGFWIYSEKLYSLPRRFTENSKKLTERAALAAGLDMVAFNSCLDGAVPASRVLNDRSEAESMGVRATPTLIVRHNPTGRKRTLEGFVSYSTLQRELKEVKADIDQTTNSH